MSSRHLLNQLVPYFMVFARGTSARRSLIFAFLLLTFALRAQHEDCDRPDTLFSKNQVHVSSVSQPGSDDCVMANSCFQSAEHQSHWFIFEAKTSGKLDFLITPDALAADFDWAIWEGGCPADPLATVTECNWVGFVLTPPYFSTGAADDPLGTFGIAPNLEISSGLIVEAGKIYRLLVDNITGNGVGFTLDFAGDAQIGAPISASPIQILGPGFFCEKINAAVFQVSGGGPSANFEWSVENGNYQLLNPAGDSVLVVFDKNKTAHSVSAKLVSSCPTSLVATVFVKIKPSPDLQPASFQLPCDAPNCMIINELFLNETSGLPISDWSATFFQDSMGAVLNDFSKQVLAQKICQPGQIWARAATADGCFDVEKLTIQPPFQPFFFENENYVCAPDGSVFQVEFDVAGGGPGAFSVMPGGQLVGSHFLSGPILSDSLQVFSIENGNGCHQTFFAQKTCPQPPPPPVTCQFSVPGKMAAPILHGCTTDSLSASYDAFGEFLQLGHARSFILHTGASAALGNLILEKKTPVFSFDAAKMTLGQGYFVSPVTGLAGPDGLAVLTDSCTKIGPGQPIIFHGQPFGIWAGDVAACPGDAVELSVDLFGEPPFSLTVFNNQTGSFSNFTTASSPFEFPVNNSLSTSYTLLTVADQFCESHPGLSAMVNFGKKASANIGPTALKICRQNDLNISTLVNFNNLILGGDSTGNWADADNSGATGQFPILEFTDVAPGKYTYIYTTAAAIAPCADSIYTIEIEVSDCKCPSLLADTLPAVCRPFALVGLDFLAKNEPGVWQIAGAPSGSTATILSNVFDATASFSGIYTLAFLYDTLPLAACPLSDSVVLKVVEPVEAGFPTMPFFEKCAGLDSIFLLEKTIAGGDAGGVWRAISATDKPFLSQPIGQLLLKNLAPGDHFFTRKTVAPAPCPTDSVNILLKINPNPPADAGPFQQLDCFHEMVKIGSAGQPDSLLFIWSNPIFGDFAQPETGEAGAYFLKVVDQKTGCFSADSVEVKPDWGIPVFEKIETAAPICFGEKNGFVRVDSVSGGMPPIVYSIDNQPFSTDFLFEKLGAGNFSLIIQDAAGCETDTVLTLDAPPVLSLFAGVDTAGFVGDSVQFFPVADFFVANFEWAGPGVCPDCWQPKTALLTDGRFVLTAFDSLGCRAESGFSVTVRRDFSMFFPNIFKPGSDGGDAFFYPKAPADLGVEIRQFSVWSRWGELVFSKNDLPIGEATAGWDGYFRRKTCPNGVYLWFAEVVLADGTIVMREGDVTVAR